jgi:hypothetical protein
MRIPIAEFGELADAARACATSIDDVGVGTFAAGSQCFRALRRALIDRAQPATSTIIMAADIAKGAKGVGKALARIDRPTDELIEQRTEKCQACPEAVLRLGMLKQCRICKCATWAKIRNASEHCPLGNW